MKRNLLAIFIAIYGIANSQSLNYQWARRAGGNADDYGNSIATDGSGNVYVVGHFYSSSISFGSTYIYNNGSRYDLYVVKYDPSGNVIWVKGAGGQGDEKARGVAVDASGNVYVVGDFESPTITFGTFTLTNASSPNAQVPDMFIAKYDSAGSVLWAKSFGGIYDEYGNGISVDASNNIYVAGDFRSTSITIGTTVLNSKGVGDALIIKLDPLGNVLWAKAAEGDDYDEGRSVFATPNGIYLAGSFRSDTLKAGSISLKNSSINSNRDVFLIKYDINGNPVWAKNGIAPGLEYLFGAAVDINGNIFISGMYDSPVISFGSFTLNNSNPGSQDIFLVKYDPSGNTVWAKSAGGISDDVGYGIVTDISGNVFLTGYMSSLVNNFDTISLNNNGGSDIFLVKYNNIGNILWAINTGGNGVEEGSALAIDANNGIYLTGNFGSAQSPFGLATLTSSGSLDMFVAKLGVATGIENWVSGNTLIIYPNPISSQAALTAKIPLQDATLTLYNSFGQVVKQMENLSGESITIQRDNLPAGLYFLLLKQENEVISTDKLVIADL